MKICFVTSECEPFVKTGGLADVCGSLPLALTKLGCEVKIFLPFYNVIDAQKHGIKPVEEIVNVEASIGEKIVNFSLFTCRLKDTYIDVFFVDCPEYFHRKKIYTNDTDEDERFILFQNAVLISLMKLNWTPDLIHCNDWQTALIPAYLNKNFYGDGLFQKTASVLSIHNIGYQGLFNKTSFLKTNFPMDDFQPMGPFELNDLFCFLKAGISYSDIVTTVSPTYAKEIQTEKYGSGLEGVLVSVKDKLFGILNGIHDEIWNPRRDNLIFEKYCESCFEKKVKNKKELLKRTKMVYMENTPLLGIVSRFAWQKGFELFEPIIKKLLLENIQIIVLGEGESQYEKFFLKISEAYPEKAAAFVEYNNELAHQITAGSDIFLMPSKYEPCGLNQMYSLKYGTVPVVRKTGGLADTVRDVDEYTETGNGFTFEDFNSRHFYSTIIRALDYYKNKEKWRNIAKVGMNEDFSWNKSAKQYIEVYEKAISLKI
jgi:starch synthase